MFVEPVLKIHWERFQAHVDLDVSAAQRLLIPYTHEPIAALSLLSEGCANTNYKVTFVSGRMPVVLRIYVRERSALQRELDVHRRVADSIPVPRHLYVDKTGMFYDFPYAVMEWIDGKMMRDLVLEGNEAAIEMCMLEAGRYLSVLRQIKFSKGGFFEPNLQVRPFYQEEEYLPYVSCLLQETLIKERLGNELHQALQQLIFNNASLLPAKDPANLSHGDYDPANILVRQVGGHWKIASILDWEFSFAGSYLLDIGTMLRYSHKLPSCYEQKFIEGIERFGKPLPKTWKKQVKLMDLICLLQLIYYNPLVERPNLNEDVVSLIRHTVSCWDSF